MPQLVNGSPKTNMPISLVCKSPIFLPHLPSRDASSLLRPIQPPFSRWETTTSHMRNFHFNQALSTTCCALAKLKSIYYVLKGKK